MRLVITDEDVVEDDVFAQWLLSKVRLMLVQKLSDEKLALLELKYKELPVLEIVEQGIDSLEVAQSSDKIVIEIPVTRSFNRTGYKLVQLCKIVNYGCLDIRGYPIFTDVFSSVSANVQSYYTQYEEEVLSYVY